VARILVIDDEAELLTVLQDLLTKAGHEVLLASSPGQGLALYRTRQPDLVITDIFIPEVDGLAVIRELHEQVKIIAISGGGTGAQIDILEDATGFGAWRTLAKPFRGEALLALVEEALRE
jgi:DNA-binding NtrC family response regulator